MKVGDFGIAKSLEATDRLTKGGTTIGTAADLAPEQASGQRAGIASDIYSLEGVLYDMLTGRVPFDADSPAAVGPTYRP